MIAVMIIKTCTAHSCLKIHHSKSTKSDNLIQESVNSNYFKIIQSPYMYRKKARQVYLSLSTFTQCVRKYYTFKLLNVLVYLTSSKKPRTSNVKEKWVCFIMQHEALVNKAIVDYTLPALCTPVTPFPPIPLSANTTATE